MIDIALISKIKGNALTFLLVGAGLFVALSINKTKNAEIGRIKNEIEVEKRKNSILGEITLMEKRVDALKMKLNAKEMSSVVQSLNALATKCGVTISFRNKQQEEPGPHDAYTRYFFELTLDAANFHKIGKFISSLEKSSEIFIVDTIQCSPQGGSKTSVKLLVSTIMIH